MEIRKRKPTGRPRINEQTRNLVVRLYNEDGMTCAEIAKSVNISERSVFNIMNERKKVYEQTKEQ